MQIVLKHMEIHLFFVKNVLDLKFLSIRVINKKKKSSILDLPVELHYYEYLIEDKSANFLIIQIIKNDMYFQKKISNNNYYCCDILKDQKKQ